MSRAISLLFEGDERDAVRAFDKVGDSSRKMAKEVDKSTDANTRLGERIGGNERTMMGTADLLDGLGGAFGLPTEGATKLFRAFGDLSGGFEVVSGVMPAITGMFPKMAGAMTFISSHPLITAITVGGVIIAGLVLLEQKTGIVSDAIKKMGGAFSWTWENIIKPGVNAMLHGIEVWLNAMSTPIRLISKLPGIPDIPMVQLPRLDVGGTVLQTGLAVVHRGEFVTPSGSSSSFGGPGGARPIIITVHGTVVTERELIQTLRDGLERDRRL